MKRVITSCDAYGQTPSFLYNGRSSCKTVWGGWITLFIVWLQLMCSVYTVFRYFDRRSPETNVDRVYIEDPEGFVVSKDSLSFGFGLEDSSGKYFIDESLYMIEASYVYTKKSTIDGKVIVDSQVQKLDLIKCSEAGFYTHNYFKNLPLKDMYCLKDLSEPSHELRITGEWESPSLGYLYFKVKKCLGLSQCQSPSVVEDKLKQGFFAVNYINFAPQSSNFSEPVMKYPASFYTTASSEFCKDIVMRMTDNEILTKSSFFGQEEPTRIKYTSTDRFVSDITSMSSANSSSEVLVKFLIRMDPIKVRTNRVYKNAFQYTAELGGMFTVINIFSIILTFRLSKFLMNFDIVKRIHMKSSSLMKLYRMRVREETVGREMNEENNVELERRDKIALVLKVKNRFFRQGGIVKKSKISPPKYNINNKRLLTSNINGTLFRNSQGSANHLRPPINPLDIGNEFNLANNGKPKIFLNNNPLIDNQKEKTSQVMNLENDLLKKTTKESVGENTETKMEISTDEFRRFHKTSSERLKNRLMKYDEESEQISSISIPQILLHSFLPFLLKKKSQVNGLIVEASQVESSFEYFNFIHLYEDVKKLKLLLLTQDQFNLLDLLSVEDIVRSKLPSQSKDRTYPTSPKEETPSRNKKRDPFLASVKISEKDENEGKEEMENEFKSTYLMSDRLQPESAASHMGRNSLFQNPSKNQVRDNGNEMVNSEARETEEEVIMKSISRMMSNPTPCEIDKIYLETLINLKKPI